MNIFAVHSNPIIAARMLCDKHVVKMTLETTQLLCTAHRLRTGFSTIEDRYSGTVLPLYKATHKNHPCVRWLIDEPDYLTLDRYAWLYTHYITLCQEYTFRYKKIHKCQKFIDHLFTTPFYDTNGKLIHIPLGYFRDGFDFTPLVNTIPQCMPEEYKVPGDTVQAYRNYYKGDKSRFAKWKYCSEPEWYSQRMKEKHEKVKEESYA